MRAGMVASTIAGMLLLPVLGTVSRLVRDADGDGGGDHLGWGENVAGGEQVVLEFEVAGVDEVLVSTEDTWTIVGGPHETFGLNAFPQHQLRITNTKSTLCDTTVKQQSGYLDISETRHLFFWFFEARNDPHDAPLMLWLNGGPGCSSIASGLLFENGPCSMAKDGNGTVRNPHSWNEHTNIIYLDQPIGSGYSYSTDGSKVDTTAASAVDMYAFLTMFLKKYPQYASSPLHIAAESWGGHYGPNLAKYIHEKNEGLIHYPGEGIIHINLDSLILANGLTEPYSQFETIADYKCGGAPYPYLKPDSMTCRLIRDNTPVCLRLIDACYKSMSKATCNAATVHCWPALMFWEKVATKIKANPYDIRRPCEENSSVCYMDIDRGETWLDSAYVKEALGADVGREFKTCNMTVNAGFYLQGEAFHNSAAMLPLLLQSGLRLLVYAGNTGKFIPPVNLMVYLLISDLQGIELWMDRLQNDFHEEFAATPPVPWRTVKSHYLAGEVRSAGGAGTGAGNYTFVQIYDAGYTFQIMIITLKWSHL
ncbi:hypothetical protein EIP91_006282 [Steccherinum ochraceum]|uniref:carboxypeptidase C n=1 Tax=Steccherinum ochraceum TaxID=92696 RepID=A0A4R0R8G2_9APHY|nr:hypothetical protein EIP91_006282 [Steccherinum ochraceum]